MDNIFLFVNTPKIEGNMKYGFPLALRIALLYHNIP